MILSVEFPGQPPQNEHQVVSAEVGVIEVRKRRAVLQTRLAVKRLRQTGGLIDEEADSLVREPAGGFQITARCGRFAGTGGEQEQINRLGVQARNSALLIGLPALGGERPLGDGVQSGQVVRRCKTIGDRHGRQRLAPQCQASALDRWHNAGMRFFLAAFAIGLCACSAPEPPGLAHLSVPEGYEVVVAAAPPLVERPMIVDMDDAGRLYVAESSGSNAPVEEQLAEKPHSILRLEDRDGDGVYDSRTVFADKLMLPEGVLWTKDAVYVTAPPVIWKLVDADDDGVAEHREVWYDAKTLTQCANDLHGPYEGLDGWIYWTKGSFGEQTHAITDGSTMVTKAAHIFRRRPEGGPIEAVLTGGMNNPVEVAFLPTGERMLTSTFLQFPELGRRDGVIHAIYGGVYGRVHRAAEAHPMTGGYLDPISHLGPAAPVGLAALESEALGFEGTNLVSTTFNTHRVLRHRLTPRGATFESEDSDLLVSSDPDFHPTDVMEDADGSLVVVDTGGWYKLCCPTSQLAKADVPGAIYRVRRKGMTPQQDPRGTELAWDVSAKELADRLDDARPFVRDRALPEHGR